ncbi:MAG: helix-turn-helix domain-containing protein [Flavobacteriales bacterium]|nr:helix-turn-helix domain-containing protein [Flavobacteriales bacterium]
MRNPGVEAENGILMGSKLRILRAAHNYTQQFVAEALGVAQPTVSRWEKDEDRIHIGELRKVAELYKVSMEWLLSPDPFVLHVHDSKVEHGANGAYHNTVHVVPQEVLDRIAAQYDAHIALLHKLTDRLMDLLGEKARKAE